MRQWRCLNWELKTEELRRLDLVPRGLFQLAEGIPGVGGRCLPDLDSEGAGIDIPSLYL